MQVIVKLKFKEMNQCLLFLGMLLPIILFSQNNATSNHTHANGEVCKFDQIHTRLLQTDSEYSARVAHNHEMINDIIQNQLNKKAAATILKVPVVVHVFHLGESVGSGTNISDAQIVSAISNMTDQYRNTTGGSIDIEIEFELAVRDPDCAATTGILRKDLSGFSSGGDLYGAKGITSNNEVAVKAQSKWPNDQYYNIWVVSEIDNNGGGSGTQGYAYFPGAGSDTDGAVMLFNAFGYDPAGSIGYNLKSYTRDNSTAVHELGHALNLYHTFQGDKGINGTGATQCPGAADGCTSFNSGTGMWEYLGDCVSDTEAHQRHASVCPTGSTNTCTGGIVSLAVLNNFMNYSSCSLLFTADQKTRMRAALTGPRASLIASKGLVSPPAVLPNTKAVSCSPVSSADGLSGGYAGIMSAEFAGVISSTNNTVNDNSTYSTSGYLDFSQECNLSANVTVGQTFTVGVTTWFNDHNVAVSVDWDNSGTFESSEKELTLVVSGSGSGGSDMASSTITVPATATIGEYLRIRFNADIGSVSTACEAPRYGQVEDYSLVVSPQPQPLNEIYLSARKNDKKVNLIKWQGEDDDNVLRYILTSSNDGKLFEEVVNFEREGYMSVYEYRDININGSKYYQVKAVLDENFQFKSDVSFVERKEDQFVSIYPNPSKGSVKLHSNLEMINVNIVNVYGQEVYNINQASKQQEIDLNNLPKGVYFVRIGDEDNNILVEKLILE